MTTGEYYCPMYTLCTVPEAYPSHTSSISFVSFFLVMLDFAALQFGAWVRRICGLDFGHATAEGGKFWGLTGLLPNSEWLNGSKQHACNVKITTSPQFQVLDP